MICHYQFEDLDQLHFRQQKTLYFYLRLCNIEASLNYQGEKSKQNLANKDSKWYTYVSISLIRFGTGAT